MAVIGSLALDRVNGARPRVGGAVYYAARAAGLLGAPVEVVARCSDDDRAVCLEPLQALGVPVTWRPGEVTAAFSFHYEGDHRVMRVDAVGDPWSADDVTTWAAAALGDATWIHVGALVRSDFPVPALAALAAAGRELLVDAQGLVRRAVVGPVVVDGEIDRSLLPRLAVLKLNEREAESLAGGLEPHLLRALGVPEIVLTLGAAGSHVITQQADERIVIDPVVGEVDPTGAGDSYTLAYAVARSRGAAPVEAARSASDFVSGLLAAR